MMRVFTKTLLLSWIMVMAAASLQAQAVVWEETFDGSANGWESVSTSPNDTSLWKWDPTGYVGDGVFLPDDLEIDSPTGDNGAMVFNGDFYSSMGDPNYQPPADPALYPKYISELTSPSIDLTAIDVPLSLRFTQLVRFLNVSPGAPGNFRLSFAYSTDDGMTWSEPIDAADGKVINTTYNADTQTFPLSGLQGNIVKLRFTYSTDFYCWVIDDLQFVERPPHDMRANANFYAIAPNAQTPGSQADAFGFLCDVENLGGTPQTNVNLNINIVDQMDNEVYDDNQDYGTVDIDTIIENISFGDYVPDGALGLYTGTYTVTADSMDVNPDNNVQTFEFRMTDSTFAKETGATRPIYPASASWNVGDPRSWAYGNHFYMPNGTGFFANTVTFSFDVSNNTAQATGQTLQVVLYEWTDFNGDSNCDTDERERVGVYLHTIDGGENWDEPITVPITGLLTGTSVPLIDEMNYVVMMEFVAEDDTRVDFGASDAYDYGAMVLNSEQQMRPRYAGMLGINANLDTEAYSSLWLWSRFRPICTIEHWCRTIDQQYQ